MGRQMNRLISVGVPQIRVKPVRQEKLQQAVVVPGSGVVHSSVSPRVHRVHKITVVAAGRSKNYLSRLLSRTIGVRHREEVKGRLSEGVFFLDIGAVLRQQTHDL
eukprot:CAMPEP_0194300150 /NCGR_PEP_ID=MMETSP0169-20130528/61103_1 /TAXON_ID=218684 /ORGANISM="Corethron pennatum, Strain L29A3" /LENGTH=104 /DNA_ID=CAMNT_0039050295 /DNA_START=1113 /DNA_END=1428 /DNA_ORIENTATION=-